MKIKPIKPIRFYPNEEFKEIIIPDKLKLRYAISNKGRLMSFVKEMKYGRILKGVTSDGYKLFKYKIFTEDKVIYKHFFFSKLIAEHFIPKDSDEQTYVLHLDRKRDNDDYTNLKWATKEEMIEFTNKSPFVLKAREKLVKHNLKSPGKKLTIANVKRIKKLLAKPEQNLSLKMIAEKYGVSDMQISRIKRGENWGHIKI